ncbi:alpha/beta fold hydrolase [Euzebyella saccharophila]|uniref:Alpha/beta fold hydrolase n=1 Tax=Euzebyella saccharophila TaxID=679664 RepID=A0ABV8JSF2_9FLAO|nr:alpha/beta hydrolase [Euzebyella saccharophila]
MNKLIPKIYGQYFNFLALFSKRRAALATFEVFSKVRKGRVLPQQKTYLEEAKDQILEIENHTIQTYQWSGKRETVLLVHGWESNTFRWRNLIAKLKDADYNIVAFDAPGHGNSSGKNLHLPLYINCIQAMVDEYAPAHVIAHSFGGMALLFNEYLRPSDYIEKMVTIGSPSEFRELLGHYQKLVGFNNRVLSAFEDYIRERFGMEVDNFSSSKFVANNHKKGLLLHDRLDILAPFHASEKVHAHWKGSRFIKTKGLGHSMHQPHINEYIVHFLEDKPIIEKH